MSTKPKPQPMSHEEQKNFDECMAKGIIKEDPPQPEYNHRTKRVGKWIIEENPDIFGW